MFKATFQFFLYIFKTPEKLQDVFFVKNVPYFDFCTIINAAGKAKISKTMVWTCNEVDNFCWVSLVKFDSRK